MLKPIYLVTGWMRSGTSMMIQALEAGGMSALYTQGDPNFELKGDEYTLREESAPYEGKLLKSLRMGPAWAFPWAGGYKTLFMERDAAEQRDSWERFRGENVAVDFIEKQVKEATMLALNRKDMDVMFMPYHDVITEPRDAFWQIANFFDVSIDIDKAAAVVNPDLCHFGRTGVLEMVMA